MTQAHFVYKKNKIKQIQKEFSNLLIQKKFFLVYQPQVDIRTGHIHCAEALLRWEGLQGSPEYIINAVEKDAALIRQLSTWILQTVCDIIIEYKEKYNRTISIAINLSAQNLIDDLFINTLFLDILKKSNVHPSLIEVELTESCAIENWSKLYKNLTFLQQYGIKTSLDDFGMKFNSLKVLFSFPFNKVKIDKIFIDELSQSPISQSPFVLSIINLLKTQHVDFVAEGVESFEVAAYLESHGCYNIQGYIFGKPTKSFPKWNMIL